jgi:hypothetical protein
VVTRKAPQIKASKPHDEAVVEMLKTDPELAGVYLATALEEASLPGGQFALQLVLRPILKM